MVKGKRMTVLIWISICILLAVIGQIFMKLGTKDVNGITIKKLASKEIISIIFNKYVFFGMVSYAAGWFLWLIVLSQTELSFAYPFLSISYALIAIISWQFFGETMNITKMVGIILIMIGVILLNLK
ncbi:MAG: EamA family transporter [Candidatus Aenigmatarchaeota archaeon]